MFPLSFSSWRSHLKFKYVSVRGFEANSNGEGIGIFMLKCQTPGSRAGLTTLSPEFTAL